MGQLVDFTCATAIGEYFITWSTMPTVGSTDTTTTDLPGGGQHSVLRFTALKEHNNTYVRCIITNINTSASTFNNALLLVQGNLIH